MNGGGPVCECDADYVGPRCSRKKSPDTKPVEKTVSGGEIAGIVVGSVLGLALIVVLFWFLYDRSV